jgi:hypothetical protein
MERTPFMLLQGDLTLISMPGLLQLLCQERRSVYIDVWRGSSHAQLTIIQGVVADAHYDLLRGDEAVCQVAVWDQGFFTVRPIEEPRNPPYAATPWESLLLDAARRHDELELTVPALLPTPDAMYVEGILGLCPAIRGLALIGYDGRLLAAIGLESRFVEQAPIVAMQLIQTQRILNPQIETTVFSFATQRLVLTELSETMMALAVLKPDVAEQDAIEQLQLARQIEFIS